MTEINELSIREREVVILLLQGKSNKQIAQSLNISARTVEFHLRNVYIKFQVNSRVELILKLVNYPGNPIIERLGTSTVDMLEKKAENKDRRSSQVDWAASLADKRNEIMKTNLRMALQNALTGFAPGVFVFMAITVLLDGVRFFIRNQNWGIFIKGSIQNQNFWEVAMLELLLLTSGYVLATSVFNSKYLNFARSRSVVAGVGAVILLGVLSIFTQGASLPMIALASLSAGILSILFIWRKTPQATAN
jgi:DNA-binding CsgD family transcriptional regulator